MQISISLVFLMENFRLGTNVMRVLREAFCLLKIASAFDLCSSTRSKQISTRVDRKASRVTWASGSHLHTGAGVRVGVMCEGGQPESSWCVLPRRPSSGFHFRDKQTLVEEPLSQSEAAARRMNARGSVTFLFTFSKRTFAFFFIRYLPTCSLFFSGCSETAVGCWGLKNPFRISALLMLSTIVKDLRRHVSTTNPGDESLLSTGWSGCKRWRTFIWFPRYKILKPTRKVRHCGW